MLEDIQNWNFASQVVAAIMLSITVGGFLAIALLSGGDTESDTDRTISELAKKHEAELQKIRDEYSAYMADNAYEDAKEAERLSNIVK